MPRATRLDRSALAVLYVDRGGVEWFRRRRDGAVLYGSCLHEEEADPVAAAEEARRRAGDSRRACVLSLGRGFVSQRLVPLPELARRELTGIFRRKAGAMAGVEVARVLFTAVAMGTARLSAEGGRSAKGRSWLLLAMNGAEIVPLRTRLRAQGFAVKRVVSGRMAAVCRAYSGHEGEQAAILVVIGRHAASVSLVHEDELVHQDVIDGDLTRIPSLASTMVNDVRNCARFWKKESRGEEVGRVVVLGLPPERGKLLSHAITAAVPGATVEAHPREEDGPAGPEEGGEPGQVGRHAVLEAALVGGTLSPELSFRLPPRRRAVGALAAATLLGVVGLGWLSRRVLTDELASMRADVRLLARQTADLDDVTDRNETLEGRLAALDAHLQRTEAIGSWGVPVDGILTDTLESFRGTATFQELDVSRSEATGETLIAIRGSVDAEPARLVARLRAVSLRLESSPTLEGVRLELPDVLPGGDGGTATGPLDFSVQATLEW